MVIQKQDHATLFFFFYDIKFQISTRDKKIQEYAGCIVNCMNDIKF